MTNLLNVSTEDTNVNLPKHVETTFVLRNNFFVVTNGEIFNYYPIKVLASNDASSLIRLERAPPVLLEGYAIIGKKIYIVPLQDLQRKIIRKSREIKRDTQNDSTEPAAKSVSTLTDAVQSVALPDYLKSGLIDLTELEISKAADATWKDQIGTLYDNPFEEENDWEIQDDS